MGSRVCVSAQAARASPAACLSLGDAEMQLTIFTSTFTGNSRHGDKEARDCDCDRAARRAGGQCH
eukprot:3373914-Rhodomonas_salina.1